MQNFIGRLWVVFPLLVALGCTAAVAPKTKTKATVPSLVSQCQDLVEQLDINHHQLTRLYQDMRVIAEGNLFYGSDEQLSMIQKSNLHILLSKRMAKYQKQLLSTRSHVDLSDPKAYITILIKALEQGVFDSAADLNQLNTYHAFIENESARENIDTAVTLVRSNMALYKELISVLTASMDRK